jgi:hypothetical protein
MQIRGALAREEPEAFDFKILSSKIIAEGIYSPPAIVFILQILHVPQSRK